MLNNKEKNVLQKFMDRMIDEHTNGICVNLARILRIKLEILDKSRKYPIYAIYDYSFKPCVWGIDYFHYFVKVGGNSEGNIYLNARGLHNEKEMIDYWGNAWKDSRPKEEWTYAIIEQEPKSQLTGWSEIDEQLEIWGSGNEIKDFTKEFADLLISTYLPEL